MKKVILFILAITISLCTTSCANERTEPETTNTTTEATETETTCNHESTEYIQKEAGYGVHGMKYVYCKNCKDSTIEEIPALPSIFTLEVKNKSTYTSETSSAIDSDESDNAFVLFDIEFNNTSDKTIEKISGTLTVMYKNVMLQLSCDFEDINLKGNSTKMINSYGFDLDLYSEDDSVSQKIYNADFEDLSFFFEPSEVIIAE